MVSKEFLIDKYEMKPHPEGGFYKEIQRGESTIDLNFGTRNLHTSIYFLIDGDNFSAFHKIRSDEYWFFHLGSAIDIHVIDEMGLYQVHRLGEEDNFQLLIKSNCWFAAELVDKSSFALVSCVVVPGFDFADFELASKDIIEIFPQHAAILSRLIR